MTEDDTYRVLRRKTTLQQMQDIIIRDANTPIAELLNRYGWEVDDMIAAQTAYHKKIVGGEKS